MTYAVSPTGVAHRFTDISWLALANPPAQVPFSLGFRSQALTLTRVSARTQGKFLRPLGFTQSFPQERKTGPESFTQDIGETSSLIFSPCYEKDGMLYDGILNRALGKGTLPEDQGCRPEKETRILSGLCPDCGWDLEGQSDSLVLVCRNCHTLWQPKETALGRIRFASARPDHAGQVLIPFWRIEARTAGMDLGSAGALRSLANLPSTVPEAPEEEDSAPAFWAPAFKIRPKVFLRISRQLTLAQPGGTLGKKIRPEVHLPITLPPREAVQSIRITLASLARPLRDHFTAVAGLSVHAESATLVYLPFESQAHEYLHPGLNLAINKNMLNLSGNL